MKDMVILLHSQGEQEIKQTFGYVIILLKQVNLIKNI